MADRGDTHYSVPSLNKWFLISSVALFAATAWMMLNDWNRAWKKYQREFRDIEIARGERETQELTKEGAIEREKTLTAAVTAAQAESDRRADELAKVRETQRLAKGEQWRIVEAAKKAKSEYNWDRFVIEEKRADSNDPALDAKQLSDTEHRMNEAITNQQVAEAKYAEATAKVAELTSGVDKAKAALAVGTRDLDRVRKRLAVLEPEDPAAKLAAKLRDAPGLDFIGPTLKVNKVVLANLTFELNFTKKRRIDMCHTCHLGIDRPGFEMEKQPFASHPRLDLYLTAKSPHPIKDVGCTICHRGSGEALDFVRADHRPANDKQEEEWSKDLGWHKQHHWDYPMLTSDFTQASCIQCHKTTMELIAPDAPKLAEGYHTFEQYGCYACHKVDWFPTKRRPGPTLKNLQAKLSPEFIASWIANPKGFRPTTWMPQFFHLQNYAPTEPVVEASKYGANRAILGQEWNDTAVAAITAFLLERAPKHPIDPMPLAGNAERGREVMRVSGCLACHNMAPFGEAEPKTHDLALERRGTNEVGPNLRGVATKVSAEWLYWWIKDPTRYWPETRMPNLRLADQDAADITAYMTEDPDKLFHDVPAGWEPKTVQMPDAQRMEVLGEQARWFFARDGRSTIEARLEGRDPAIAWNDRHTLEIAVGEKLVAHHGCFSCHEIDGMEAMQPIGTELSNWGSKTVDKLDFGFAYKKALSGLPELPHEYREGWLMRKLHAPRSFDLEKVKNPIEKLRMPYFAFTDEQVRSIATFVVGLVDDEVQHAKFIPRPEQIAMDTGLRVVRQKNCLACHVVDPGTVTYEDDHGLLQTVSAELLALEDQVQLPPHDLEKLKAALTDASQEEVGLRLLRPEPALNANFGDRVFVKGAKLKSMTPPHGGEFVRVITDYYFNGIETFDAAAANPDEAFSSVTADPDHNGAVEDVDGKFRVHSNEPYDKIRWTFAPPVLWNEGGKLQRAWFQGFLNDVVPLRHQVRVRMPSFHFADGESESVADYFANKSALEWPARFARSVHLSVGGTLEEVAKKAGLTADQLAGIENGNRADTASGMPKLQAFATSLSFAMSPAPRPSYDPVHVRSAAVLAQREKEVPGHLELGRRLIEKAVNCYQCHFNLGKTPPADPIAWAPDLALTHERLREDWVLEWLRDPQSKYPGTSMPANFSGDPPQYQDTYPKSNNEQQLRAVLDYLFNFDRANLKTDELRSAMTTPKKDQ